MCLRLQARWLARLRFAGEERGVELLEAGLVFPLLLALLIGVVWLGRAYNIYQTITRAAREGARFAVAPSCACCPSCGDPSANTFPSDTDVKAVINNALSAASMDPTKANPAISIQRSQVLNPTDPTVNQVQGVVISFGYPVRLVIPFTKVNVTNFTVNTSVQMRQEF